MKTKKILCLLMLFVLLLSACGNSSPAVSDAPPAANTPAFSPEPDAELQPKPDETTPELQREPLDLGAYQSLLAGLAELPGAMGTYSVYDMDADGVPELISRLGSGEAELTYYFYSLAPDNSLLELGSFSASHSVLYAHEQTGIIHVSGMMGYQTVTHITLSDGKLSFTELEAGPVGDGGNYSNPSPLSVCYVSDPQLLSPDAQLIGKELMTQPEKLPDSPMQTPEVDIPPQPTPEISTQSTQRNELPYIEILRNPDQPIYAGPGYDYAKTGTVEIATGYTIVEEASDYEGNLWGRLKSGAGWIDLSNARAFDGIAALVTASYVQGLDLEGTDYYLPDGGDYYCFIEFNVKAPVTNVQLLALEFTADGIPSDFGQFYSVSETLHSLPDLEPEQSYIVALFFPGDLSAYGLRFTDENGLGHEYLLSISLRNGELVLSELGA